MLIALILIAILVIVWVIRRKSIDRFWRIILFGLSILSDGRSKLVRLFTGKIETIDSIFNDNGLELTLRVYQPAKSHTPLPAIIIYHGATPKGIEHPAMNLLARNMARLGIRVFLPELPKLQQLYFNEETYPRIIRIFNMVAEKSDVITNKILIMGVSFSGGVIVKASTETDIEPAGVVSFGSYFNLADTMKFFFTGKAGFGTTELDIIPHEYTKAVWFWNYLQLLDLPFEIESVQTCIGHFIREESEQVEQTFLDCSPEQRSFLKQVFDPRDRSMLHYYISIEARIFDSTASISPRTAIENIRCPAFIIHGIHDNMVPYTQSLEFIAALEKAGKEHYYYIMRSYAHSQSAKSSLPEFVSEIRNLYKFLTQLLMSIE